MSKYNQGILGPFSGKVGPVVGAFWKGRNVMRVRPAHVTNPQTTDQMTVRQRLTILSKAFAGMRDVLALGYKVMAKNLAITPTNAAIKNNNNSTVLTGTYPSVVLDAQSLKFSTGSGYNVVAPQCTNTGNTVNVTWTNNAGASPSILDDDSVIIVAYNYSLNETFMDATATRVDQAAQFTVPATWQPAGDPITVHVFTMDSAKEDKISDSVLAGTLS